MKNLILKYGLIFGVFYFILEVLYEYGFASGFLNLGLLFLISFLLLWIVGKEYKRHNNGYATFISLLKTYIPMFLIGLLISKGLDKVYDYVYDYVISDATDKEIREQRVKNQLKIFDSLGYDEVELIKEEERIRASYENEEPFSMYERVLEFFMEVFIFFIISTIGAAFFYKIPEVDKT